MNKWILGRCFQLMEEAGGEGGGAGGEGGTGGADNGDTGGGDAGGDNGGDNGGEGKPFLGNEGKDGEGGKGGEGGEAGKGKPEPAKEEDYLKAVVKDETLLGNDKNVQLDSALIKAMIPKAQELGVSPDSLGKLANALAKAQLDQGKEALKSRIDYFNKMKAESMQKYTEGDFKTINAGIDKWFKPNGVMNNVIRNSELGADPEFLALMHYLGKQVAEDNAAGAGAGGGGSGVDPNGIDGLSKMW